MRRPATVIVAALALASACSGGSDTPRALPSLTSSATPSATAVAVPSAATAHTPFGAAAFVRFYYDQLNQAFSHADPSALSGLSDPACGTCKSYTDAALQFRAQGQHVQGDSAIVVSAEAPPEQAGVVAVDVFFSVPAHAIVDNTGAIVKRFAARSGIHKTVYVARTAAAWQVRAVKDGA